MDCFNFHPTPSVPSTSNPSNDSSSLITSAATPILIAAADDDQTTAFYDKIYTDYHGVHGYVATILCSFGLLANLCNILVLTRAEMFSTINMLLTAIAACDSTLMLTYIIYLAHFQLRTFECLGYKYTLGWAIFTVAHADLSVALRACSLWLSVVMAALRSHILSRHQVLLLQSRYIANKRLGYKLIISTVVGVILMTIPVFVNHTIEPMSINPSRFSANNRTYVECPKYAWIVVPPAITLKYDCLILKLGYWTNGLLLKLIPCLLLTYYLIKLIHFVRMHMRVSQAKFGERETINSLKPTTFLLVTILLVTLLCELPNALASLFSGIRSFAYGVMIYKSLGDIFDLLALVNGITSFILYCTMSQMFRETFYNLTYDLREYFSRRSRDYYRRWSTNLLLLNQHQSQSVAEFHGGGGGRGGGEEDDDEDGDGGNGQIDNLGANIGVDQSEGAETLFYNNVDEVARKLKHGGGKSKKNRRLDDRYRLLESFDLLHSMDRETAAASGDDRSEKPIESGWKSMDREIDRFRSDADRNQRSGQSIDRSSDGYPNSIDEGCSDPFSRSLDRRAASINPKRDRSPRDSSNNPTDDFRRSADRAIDQYRKSVDEQNERYRDSIDRKSTKSDDQSSSRRTPTRLDKVDHKRISWPDHDHPPTDQFGQPVDWAMSTRTDPRPTNPFDVDRSHPDDIDLDRPILHDRTRSDLRDHNRSARRPDDHLNHRHSDHFDRSEYPYRHFHKPQTSDHQIDQPIDHQSIDHPRHNRHTFGPSPSTSSDQLLANEEEVDISIKEERDLKKTKSPRKWQQQKNNAGSLPMFDYASLNLIHTRTKNLGSSLPSPQNMEGDIREASDDTFGK